ncbi:MAG: AAA family ATPase, partial [Clostridiales bacterium]
QLTEAVRRNPYAVVLLDEIEKAHPEVFNILLQVLDDGRLTDSMGRTVDFSNTIIIMTSNVGAQQVYGGSKNMGFLSQNENESDDYEASKERYMEDLKTTFRPEFINRVDDIIVFHPLTEDDIVKIADLMLNEVRKNLSEQNIVINVDTEVKKYLAETGYDKTFGARPLRRTILQKVEDPMADYLLKGEFKPGDTISVKMEDGKIIFTK